MGCWNINQEVCASCRYWSGCREVDFTGSHFYAKETSAQCNKPFGPFRGICTGEGSWCPGYESYS